MANLGSLAALIADIDAKVTTNAANENTGARVNTCLQNIADTLYALSGSDEKVWEGYLTQTGTSAPTITVLTNTLGGDPVLSYDQQGTYLATLSGAFGTAKTSFWSGPIGVGGGLMTDGIHVFPADDDTLAFISGLPGTGVLLDGILTNTYFRITVKP